MVTYIGVEQRFLCPVFRFPSTFLDDIPIHTSLVNTSLVNSIPIGVGQSVRAFRGFLPALPVVKPPPSYRINFIHGNAMLLIAVQ